MKRIVTLLMAATLLFGSSPIVFAASCSKSPPPTPQAPGALCDNTPACFTNAKGKEVNLPQKPCGGNYVCRPHKTAPALNSCQCAFGSFEMPLVKDQILDVCRFIDSFDAKSPFKALIKVADWLANYITAVTVAVGLVIITFGGYRYMTAGGDASKIGSAKTIIGTALLGIALALVGWIILNTISTQFTAPPDPLPTKSTTR
jgi:hypothetical protein